MAWGGKNSASEQTHLLSFTKGGREATPPPPPTTTTISRKPDSMTMTFLGYQGHHRMFQKAEVSYMLFS